MAIILSVWRTGGGRTSVERSTCRGETRYRPGGGETICPRRWQFEGGWHIFSPPIGPSWIRKSWRIYVRPRTGPQSAHLWWPAVAKLQAASVPIA